MFDLASLGPRSFDTKEGWAHFVQEPPSRAPRLPTPEQWSTVSTSQKREFNGERLRHHCRFTIRTPIMKEIHDDLLRLARTSIYRPPGARPGAVIDGLGALGKTTILAEFGRLFEREIRTQFGVAHDDDDEFIPVCYVSLPATASIRALNASIAEFYGVSVPSRATAEQLTHTIKTVARRCNTVLFLIDEVHYLNLRNESDRKVNDHLKHLANGIAATFVYAGIGLRQRGFLAEGSRGGDAAMSQIQRRFKHYEISPFQIATPDGEREWKSLIKTLERELVLFRQPPGSLVALHQHLFERTSGVIGSITELIRQAANLAIEEGSERITQPILDRIELDTSSEAEFERRAPRQAQKRPRAARVQRARNEQARQAGAAA
jgi:hypothetical protein